MLRRNLLYTAVTRAKAKVILIGQKQAVFIAIHKCDVGQRNTVLADRIVDELLQEEKCFSLKDLAVNGNDMMAIGLKGKSIGNALQACLDAVMDERVANDHTALLTLAQEQMIADTDQILSDFANDYKRMS